MIDGATQVTHLFNGMRGLHHREPGVVGAALAMNELAVELIADGVHVRPELVDYVFRTKHADKVVLITDALSPAGNPEGFEPEDYPVAVRGGCVRMLNDDSLVGSILTMDEALRKMVDFTGQSIGSIVHAMTMNPARQIGIDDRKGSIEPGKDADLIILDEGMNVIATFVKGNCVYSTDDNVKP
ncbi:N-acetylglucosamine-6-phosphate deacetylase [compost metagenome]